MQIIQKEVHGFNRLVPSEPPSGRERSAQALLMKQRLGRSSSSGSSSSSSSDSSEEEEDEHISGGRPKRQRKDNSNLSCSDRHARLQQNVGNANGPDEVFDAGDVDELLVDLQHDPMPTPNQAVAMIAQEMNRLSFEDRLDMLHQAHCVVEPVPETQEFVRSKLAELQFEIDAISDKSSLDRATQLAPNYVTDHSFRLLFLRAHKFRAQAAARHMVAHFREKEVLFGTDLLGKDIAFDDLNEQDVRALGYGRNQVFPWRDPAGRPVMGVRFPEVSREDLQRGFLTNMMRASWYVISQLVRHDERAQRLGVVCVAENARPCHPEAYEIVQTMAKRRRGWPVNLAITHYCGPSTPQMKGSLALVQVLLEKRLRLRTMSHLGNANQVAQQLRRFGIRSEALTLVHDLELSMIFKAHTGHERKQIENGETDEHSTAAASSSQIEEATKSSAMTTTEGHIAFASAGDSLWTSSARVPGVASKPCPTKPLPYPSIPHVPPPEPAALMGRLKSDPEQLEPFDGASSPIQYPSDLSTSFSNSSPIPDRERSGSAYPFEPDDPPAPPAVVQTPNAQSILFGRGAARDHPGNMHMHRVVSSRLDEYERARKLQKTAMSEAVVRELQEAGGKFLKKQKHGNLWVETSDEDAREKVGKIFRRMIQLRRERLKNGDET